MILSKIWAVWHRVQMVCIHNTTLTCYFLYTF